MFESLSEKLQGVFDDLRGKGRLSEDDIRLAMREVRAALLDADVSFKVVREFVSKTSARCISSHNPYALVAW